MIDSPIPELRTAGTRTDEPLISVIIPTKDAGAMLELCLGSIFRVTNYPRFEVLCLDNGTTEEEALRTLRSYPVQHHHAPGPFNFSRVNNEAARLCAGEYLLFLNNDIEVLDADWLSQMLAVAEQDSAGAVGPLLLYPDRTIQHAGVILGPRGTADHVHRGERADAASCWDWVTANQKVSAVTGACLMVRRSVFAEVGGFDEHYFSVYQDVDLCLRIRETGRSNWYTPRARLIHHESASRGIYYDLVDRTLLLDRWEPLILAEDPYYRKVETA